MFDLQQRRLPAGGDELRVRIGAMIQRARTVRCPDDHRVVGPAGSKVAICRIQALMAARGLTTHDLAVATGRKHTTVRAWFQRAHNRVPHDDVLLSMLLTLFRVPLPVLLDSGEPCAVQYVKAGGAAMAGISRQQMARIVAHVVPRDRRQTADA
jgi:hypothetical protein